MKKFLGFSLAFVIVAGGAFAGGYTYRDQIAENDSVRSQQIASLSTEDDENSPELRRLKPAEGDETNSSNAIVTETADEDPSAERPVRREARSRADQSRTSADDEDQKEDTKAASVR